MKRDWSKARAKVDAERRCRVCGNTGRVEAAHVIGRARDRDGVVAAESIVPLCGPATDSGSCHGRYDGRKLDLLPYLTPEEQTRAVADAGGIVSATIRVCGGRT